MNGTHDNDREQISHLFPVAPQGEPMEPKALIPRRIDTAPSVFSLPLTRRQRTIFFLIDGQRTIAHIARCSRKEIAEVQGIVQELQHMGLTTF
jgi:hypothetical protein